MSIKVNTRKLNAWRNDLADQIRVEKLNEVAEDYAHEIAKELGALKCPSHPGEDSYITIIADRAHYIVTEAKFCCCEFEKKVGLKIER
jgi:hypothetical protein